MKRPLALAAVSLSLVLLAGCTSETTSETITITPGQSGTFTNGDSTIVVGGDATDAPRDETAYLSEIRDGGAADSVLLSATDADLLAAGQAACDQLAQGIDDDDIALTLAGRTVKAGSDDATAIVDAASIALCG